MTSRFGRGALSQFALHIVEIGLDRLAAADVLNDDEPAERFHVADDVLGNDADAAFVAVNTGRLEGSAVQAEFVRHCRVRECGTNRSTPESAYDDQDQGDPARRPPCTGL